MCYSPFVNIGMHDHRFMLYCEPLVPNTEKHQSRFEPLYALENRSPVDRSPRARVAISGVSPLNFKTEMSSFPLTFPLSHYPKHRP